MIVLFLVAHFLKVKKMFYFQNFYGQTNVCNMFYLFLFCLLYVIGS